MSKKELYHSIYEAAAVALVLPWMVLSCLLIPGAAGWGTVLLVITVLMVVRGAIRPSSRKLSLLIGLLVAAIFLAFLMQVLDLVITSPYAPNGTIETLKEAGRRATTGYGLRTSTRILGLFFLGAVTGSYLSTRISFASEGPEV